jgi:putative NADPH-quinone reductase
MGLLRARTAVVFNTSNTPPEREMELFGDPLDRLWKTCILDFCGVKNVVRETFSVVIASTPKQRAEWLGRAEEIVAASFPR